MRVNMMKKKTFLVMGIFQLKNLWKTFSYACVYALNFEYDVLKKNQHHRSMLIYIPDVILSNDTE